MPRRYLNGDRPLAPAPSGRVWRQLPSWGYSRWAAMLYRCYNPKNPNYPNYGGRGIRVCRRWRKSVAAFCRDVGLPPTRRHSLDRINVNGHYEPGNVRWSTPVVQANNTRRRAVSIPPNEGARRLVQWRERNGMKTQPETAALLGVRVETVCRWERGRTQPRLHHAHEIMRLTGISFLAWRNTEAG